jgi:hypothetical protein
MVQFLKDEMRSVRAGAPQGSRVFRAAIATASGARRTAHGARRTAHGSNMLHRNINGASLAGNPRTSIRTFRSIT